MRSSEFNSGSFLFSLDRNELLNPFAGLYFAGVNVPMGI
jgi:hypothetical protein